MRQVAHWHGILVNPPSILPFLLVFGLAAISAAALTPLAGTLGRRLGMLDVPDDNRRIHKRIIPRSGGIGLFLAFVLAIIAILLLPDSWLPTRVDPSEGRRLAGLMAGATFAFAFGVVDDRWELPAMPQFIVQLVASLIAISGLVFIQIVDNPFTGEIITFPMFLTTLLTIFWFMGMMNTVNWLDGLDGLAAGVGAILCAVLAVHMIREGQYTVALLPLALLGATLGFLPFNFHLARIHMGSSGSYFLGFALAALGIIAGARVATVLLVMGLPVLDVAWLIWNRWRQGRPVFQGGRDHLHHHLLAKGFSQRQIVLAYYTFCALFGLLALLISDRVFKLVTLVVLAVIAVLLLWWADQRPSEP